MTVRSVRMRWASAAVAAGAAVLLTVGVAVWRARPAPDVGALPVAPAPPSPSGTGVAVRSGTLPSRAAVVAPVQVRLGDEVAAVRPAGVDGDTGLFEVPEDVNEAGWYRYGPGLEAAAGSIVLAGHVDSAAQGTGVFARLTRLREGDRIEVIGDDGVRRAFRMVARETYRKTALPLDSYFARDGAVRLTLITCGGPFDKGRRSYRDNIVVTAVPAD